ncbi:MAG TPA: zinc-dependent metalloprotease family protein, partial [Candidatus Nanopelagicales bacterium]|nr:zinc-dependent metalloprotease family protein [Candidatus Nanopelagicales bacterium]
RTTATGGLVSDLGTSSSQDPAAGVDVAGVEVVSSPTSGTTSTGSGVAATDLAVSSGTAVHQVLVVVARPAGGSTTSVTPAAVAATVSHGVNTYWSTVTDGKVGFAATAYPSVVATTNVPCANGSVSSSGAFWNEIKSKVGWTDGSGKHLVVYFPAFAACGGIAGLGTVGSGVASGGVTWSNGYNDVGVIGHELGHNIGLGHSQELDCTVGGVRVMDAAPSSCTDRSYWDTTDIMALSWNYQGFLNASHLRKLGLLDATAQATPADNGSVTLRPIEYASGLRVLTLSDGAARYVVEYRQAVGLDSWMSGIRGWGGPGVTVRKEFDLTQPGTSSFDATESYLLDGNPATPDTSLGSVVTTLPTGIWLDLADGRLGLRITSTSSSGATIEYRNGPAADDPRYVAAPKPVVSTPVPSMAVGPIRPASTGAVIPVRWSWLVTTPSTDQTTAASVTTQRAGAKAVAGLTTWAPTGFRAYATSADGTVVTSYARAYSKYVTERSTRTSAYSRGWTGITSSAAMGGSLRIATARSTYVTTTVTGRGVGVLLARGPRYGKVAVYLDGVRVAILSMHASTSSVRVAWSTTFATAGTHRVRLVNLTGGTYGHVGFDGAVALA